MSDSALVWFRQDLRLADNPALAAARQSGRPLIALYILDDETPGKWRIGAAARWWLDRSLAALGESLERIGAPLVLRRGPAERILPEVAKEARVRAVYWNRCYEPFAVARDRELKARLQKSGLAVESFKAALLAEPWEIESGSGGAYRVFTPFWRRLSARIAPEKPPAAPRKAMGGPRLAGDRLSSWNLKPRRPNWAKGFEKVWQPGESGARKAAKAFLDAGLARYERLRDFPAEDGASRLSPHLHWGEISPRQLWIAARAAVEAGRARSSAAESFLRELGWREFCHHLLFHFPELPEKPLRQEFARLRWRDDKRGYDAWCRGATGYPLVDASLRELWTTGWMHNRVRMIAASFLIKDLLIPWQRGEEWFWDTLVDADLANNAANWQWVAGCGADAAPFFRVFNPSAQGAKFDPDGTYIRRWVPELAKLPDDALREPWTADAAILKRAGVRLGKTYPEPLVDHAAARERALAAYKAIR